MLALLRSHAFGGWLDAHTPKVEAVGVETCVDGRIAAFRHCRMMATSFGEQLEFFVREEGQQRAADALDHLRRARAMFLVVAVGLATRIVEVSKLRDNIGVDFWRQEPHAVIVDTVLMCDAVDDAVAAMPLGKFAKGLNVRLHIYSSIFIDR